MNSSKLIYSHVCNEYHGVNSDYFADFADFELCRDAFDNLHVDYGIINLRNLLQIENANDHFDLIERNIIFVSRVNIYEDHLEFTFQLKDGNSRIVRMSPVTSVKSNGVDPEVDNSEVEYLDGFDVPEE